jgi:transcriptional regulator with XRE-family HTH domain
MNQSLGERLRHERERRQIDLKSIAETTKINLHLLEGLEHDNVARWPSGIFRKSFIRAYAEAIGLDAEPIVREFVERYPDPDAVAVESELPQPRPRLPVSLPTRPVVLKLTIVSAGSTFSRGALLSDLRKRWVAAVCDATVSCTIAAGLFLVLGHFWRPLGVSMLLYYVGGIVLLGNTPGVCLFAPDTRPAPHPATTPNDVELV